IKLRWRKSDLLTHGHAGGTMIYSQGKKRHAVCVFASVSVFALIGACLNKSLACFEHCLSVCIKFTDHLF
ncbi:MAG: hypothetical protein ACTIJZ_13500, partial [Halomonadaceae bacterium]